MIFEQVSNIVKSKTKYEDIEGISITPLGNIGYNICWNDLKLWGKTINGKECVRYTKVKIGDVIPNELNACFYESSLFDIHGDKLLAKYIGRYIAEFRYLENESRSWVLDVIFDNDSSQEEEFLTGKLGMFSTWKYNYDDSNMINFVMEKVEKIPCEERTVINVLRHMMSEFSGDNSETGLIDGKWGGGYELGREPSAWTSPTEFFLEWSRLRTPIKYGQCWIFAECLTVCLRFLGIPTRTVYAKNSHINPSLSCSIDFFEDEKYMKSHELSDEIIFKEIEDMNKFLSSCLSEDQDKAIEDDELFKPLLFSTKDSMWNIHYWNEVYISRNGIIYHWEALDSCPYTPSTCEPYKGKKILGPCKVSSIKSNYADELYDYRYLHSSVNSPFRIWIKDTMVLNGEVITIPYVHSLVFPFYQSDSIMMNNAKLKKLFGMRIELSTRSNLGKINITDKYRMPFDILYRYLTCNNPIFFKVVNDSFEIEVRDDEGEYYVQQVIIDKRNSVSKIRRQKKQLNEIIPLTFTHNDAVMSILIIKDSQSWVQLVKL